MMEKLVRRAREETAIETRRQTVNMLCNRTGRLGIAANVAPAGCPGRLCCRDGEQDPVRLALHTGDRDAAPDPRAQCANRSRDRDGEIVHRVR